MTWKLPDRSPFTPWSSITGIARSSWRRRWFPVIEDHGVKGDNYNILSSGRQAFPVFSQLIIPGSILNFSLLKRTSPGPSSATVSNRYTDHLHFIVLAYCLTFLNLLSMLLPAFLRNAGVRYWSWGFLCFGYSGLFLEKFLLAFWRNAGEIKPDPPCFEETRGSTGLFSGCQPSPWSKITG